MLLSALNSAREKARSVHCVNNLKQISVALAGYSNDYQEWLIPYKISRNTSDPHWHGYIWYGILSGLDPRKGLTGGGYGTKLGYIKNGTTYKFVNGTFNCASESKPCDTSIRWENSASYHFTHYALNRWLFGEVGYFPIRKLSEVKRPSDAVAAGDDEPDALEGEVGLLGACCTLQDDGCHGLVVEVVAPGALLQALDEIVFGF